MKRRGPRVIFKSRAREAAERADGYAPSAESQHSRRAARGERMAVAADTPADLLKRLRRAKVRHGSHGDPIVRQRAGEDMRELQWTLRRLGYAV